MNTEKKAVIISSCLSPAGIDEKTRKALCAAYRKRDGSFSTPSVSALRLALRDVRRPLEGNDGCADSDELSRREDLLEML